MPLTYQCPQVLGNRLTGIQDRVPEDDVGRPLPRLRHASVVLAFTFASACRSSSGMQSSERARSRMLGSMPLFCAPIVSIVCPCYVTGAFGHSAHYEKRGRGSPLRVSPFSKPRQYWRFGVRYFCGLRPVGAHSGRIIDAAFSARDADNPRLSSQLATSSLLGCVSRSSRLAFFQNFFCSLNQARQMVRHVRSIAIDASRPLLVLIR